MDAFEQLFNNNLQWSSQKKAEDPQFFERLAKQQTPQFLWIGCADSRVPANEIVGLLPGELFVHRNVANVVVHTDLNCLSVLHFAIEILKVRHVIVCGHYGCSGVASVARHTCSGISENWLRHVEDVAAKHSECLACIDGDIERENVLCELNVIEQVRNVCRTGVVKEAWLRGQDLAVHGVIYSLKDGILRNLEVTVENEQGLMELPERFRMPSKHGHPLFKKDQLEVTCSQRS